ncbi:hypothetical protein M9458_040770, partial [Cirrhinus mrigala]
MCYYVNFTEALVFQLKKRPPDYAPITGRKPDSRPTHGSIPPEKLPYLVELSP